MAPLPGKSREENGSVGLSALPRGPKTKVIEKSVRDRLRTEAGKRQKRVT